MASRALLAVAARSLAGEDDVTLPQFRALVVLAGEQNLSVGQLAQALDIQTSTATRLCDRLERKKLIRRKVSDRDRRSVDVQLAPDGRRLVARVYARRRRDIARTASRMSPAARTQAAAALTAFAEAAGENHADESFRRAES